VPEYTRHTVPLDRAALEKQRREFVARARWAAAHGSMYAVLVAPDKETIYPELLPDWLTKPVRPQSILDQISAELMRSREVHFVDVRRRLWDVKNRYVLYRRLDSHWNDLGAYHAYACLMASLAQAAQQGRHQRWARGLEPLPLGSFRIREVMDPAGFSGMMGLYSVRSENVLLEQDEERFIRRDRAPRDFDEVTTENDHATTPLLCLGAEPSLEDISKGTTRRFNGVKSLQEVDRNTIYLMFVPSSGDAPATRPGPQWSSVDGARREDCQLRTRDSICGRPERS